jgi:hypothetical protein
MAQVSIDGRDLIVEMEGWDKLWALRSRLTIPLSDVRGATADPGIAHEVKGLRVAGARVPGVITAGSFHQDGERIFWDVHNPAKVVVIELKDERFARLVIEVSEPATTVALIEEHLTTRHQS